MEEKRLNALMSLCRSVRVKKSEKRIVEGIEDAILKYLRIVCSAEGFSMSDSSDDEFLGQRRELIRKAAEISTIGFQNYLEDILEASNEK